MLFVFGAGEGGMSQEEKAKMVLDDLADRLPDQFDMEDIRGRVDEYTPYVMVAIQVCVDDVCREYTRNVHARLACVLACCTSQSLHVASRSAMLVCK